jgi:hypothetical protein
MVLDGSIPAKVIASEINKPYTTMLREINPYDSGAKVGVDLLVPLMAAAKSVEPLRSLAQEMGYIIVPMRAQEGGSGDPVAAALKLLEEFGELSKAMQSVLNKNRLDAEEFALVERCGFSAVMAALDLIESLRAQSDLPASEDESQQAA